MILLFAAAAEESLVVLLLYNSFIVILSLNIYQYAQLNIRASKCSSSNKLLIQYYDVRSSKTPFVMIALFTVTKTGTILSLSF